MRGAGAGSFGRLRTLSLLLTERCNLSCAYCYLPRGRGARAPVARGQGAWSIGPAPVGRAQAARSIGRRRGRPPMDAPSGPGRMAPPVARAAIDLLLAAPAPNQTLVFTGGEPLLEFPLLRRAVLYARRKRPLHKRLRIIVNSNGTLLTPRMVSFFAEQEVELQLSFDGGAEAQSRRARGTFARLDRLLRGIRRTRPLFFRRALSVAMTVGPETVPFLAASIRYFLSRQVSEIRLGALFPRWTEPAPALLDLLDAQFDEVLEDSLRHWDATGETPLAMFRSADDRSFAFPAFASPSALPAFDSSSARARRSPKEPTPIAPEDQLCHAGMGGSLAIDPSGNASVCPFLLSADFSASEVSIRRRSPLLLGPIGDPKFGERFGSIPQAAGENSIFRRAGKRSSFGECASCGFASACVACPASILFGAGDQDRIPDLQCALFRTAARHRARYLDRRGARYSAPFAELLRSILPPG